MDSVWEKSSSNSSKISTSKLSCVPGTIVFVPGGSLEVSFIKSTSRWEMRESCGWRWWVVLIPRDYLEFGFDGDGSSDFFFFSPKALFLKYRSFITKQLLLEEKCYNIPVNISCDGNTFQLQFLCFFCSDCKIQSTLNHRPVAKRAKMVEDAPMGSFAWQLRMELVFESLCRKIKEINGQTSDSTESGDFLLTIIGNHHETTIWENCFFFFPSILCKSKTFVLGHMWCI